jgi:hypothetical protein
MANPTRKRPKTPPYSDIDLTRWREYDHVWTDSLWHIEARDRTGGHQLDYHNLWSTKSSCLGTDWSVVVDPEDRNLSQLTFPYLGV